MESITLYYKEGSSDKVYTATLEPREGGFCVNFAFGRRHTTLQTGTKTQKPVSYEAARAIYDKLVREKQAKGYTPGGDGTPYRETQDAGRVTNILPQLLNAIEAEQTRELINSSMHLMQEKMDGRRLLLRKEGGKVTGINRLGLVVGIPETLEKSALLSPQDFVIDGEAIGDHLHAFDLLKLGAQDTREFGYRDRQQKLQDLVGACQFQHIVPVRTAHEPQEKQQLFEMLEASGREGVVFKHIEAPYKPGRPASGGAQIKFKFWNTASFIVSEINNKRSVFLELINNGKHVPAGNVTIPTNQPVPEVGQVVECRYLYAFKESGCIYQPTYLGVRDDIPRDECTVDQLKWKTA